MTTASIGSKASARGARRDSQRLRGAGPPAPPSSATCRQRHSMAPPFRIGHAWRRLPPVLPALVALFWLAGARSDAFLTESATACIRADACGSRSPGRAIKALASSSAGLGWVQSPTPASAFTAGASAAVCALRPSPGLGLAVRVALRGLRLRRGALGLPAVLGISSSFEVAGKSGRGLQPVVRSKPHTLTETQPHLKYALVAHTR